MTLQTDVAYRPLSACHAYVDVKLHAQGHVLSDSGTSECYYYVTDTKMFL